MKILLDTNFLLIPSQFNVDIFTELHRLVDGKYTIYILDRSVAELRYVATNEKQSMKNRRAAKLGLQLLKVKKVKILKSKLTDVDDELASIKGYVIATQDMALKRRIKGKNIILRAKKTLIFA